MKNLAFIIAIVLLFIGCSYNAKNLTFVEDNNLRVSFTCHVPFDDVRLVRSFEEKNTTKDVYYVEFQNIYESYFELTHTTVEQASFSLEDYLLFLKNEGARIEMQEEHNSILYITFFKGDRTFNQIVSASWNTINIATAEPMMFNAIKKHCSQ